MSKPTGKLIRLTSGDVGAYSKPESDAKFQLKGNYAPAGNYALKGESYTKAEGDARYQPKGSYQPAGNYALKGESYTKAETYSKTEVDNKFNGQGGKNTALKAANGWWKCADTGLIIQWGLATHAKKTMFPIAFPTACTQIVLGCNGVTGSSGYYYKTNVSFEVNTGGGRATSTSYLAIGY
ncbi:hypothetical protein ABN063_05715 [Providencia vermicola]